jgi:hypothetical protein
VVPRLAWVPGFGPFPIVFSTNLFLWFKDDWFALQFLLLAVGFLGKAFVRWERDGQARAHLQPVGLLAGAVLGGAAGHRHDRPDLGAGDQHHLQPRAAHLPGAVLHWPGGDVLLLHHAVTASAAATLFGASALYMAVTGVPYFVDSEIPAAVFLGMHLLVTDPSTSPRTPFGRVIFGVGYGLGVFGAVRAARRDGAADLLRQAHGACRCSTSWCRPSTARAALGDRAGAGAAGAHGPLGRTTWRTWARGSCSSR